MQLLRASGCRVIGIDFDETKCKLAKASGAEVINLSQKEDLSKLLKYIHEVEV